MAWQVIRFRNTNNICYVFLLAVSIRLFCPSAESTICGRTTCTSPRKAIPNDTDGQMACEMRNYTLTFLTRYLFNIVSVAGLLHCPVNSLLPTRSFRRGSCQQREWRVDDVRSE